MQGALVMRLVVLGGVVLMLMGERGGVRGKVTVRGRVLRGGDCGHHKHRDRSRH